MRKIATTTNYGLYLNDDDTETFLSWRNKLNGDTGTSNMNIIDDALNDHDTAIESVKSDLSEHTGDATVHLTSDEHTSLTTHLADTDIHVTAEDKEIWSSGGFSWNLAYDTKSMESWSRSSTAYLTLEEDDDGFNVATYSSSGSTTGRYIRGGFIPYEDIAGVECTVSVMARSDDAESMVTDGGGLRIILQVNEPDVIGTSLATKTFDLTGEGMTTEWVKYSQTFTYSTSAATDTCEVNFRLNNYSYYTMEVKQLKVEYGDTATEWTPHISEYNSDGVAATADALTTAVDLSVDLTSTGTISFDGSTSVAIPIAEDSVPLSIEYGGTGGTTGVEAMINILYSSTDYTTWESGYYFPIVSSEKAHKMHTKRILNSLVYAATAVDSTEFDDYASYYIPLSPSSSADTLSYKITPNGLLAWVENNISVSGTTDLSNVTGTLSTDYGGTGNTSGTATGLTTAINLSLDLASEAGSVSFDGTADTAIPVSSTSGALPTTYGGTGNTNGTATGLTTAVDLSVSLSATAGTVSFDGTSAATIPISSDSGALPVTYGGTGGTSAAAALYNIGYSGGTTAYYLAPGSYYVPFVGSSSSYSKKMTLSRLINSAVAGGTDADLSSSTYTSYYIPLVSGTASNSSSSANSTYKFTPNDLLEWIEDNISVTGAVIGTYEGDSTNSSGSQDVELGFEPSFVLVLISDDESSLLPWCVDDYVYWYGGYTSSSSYMASPSGSSSTSIVLTTSSNGFTVANARYSSHQYAWLNYSGYTYYYIAFT